MSEILTESFCERCGTRYTFESAAPRGAARLKGLKVVSRGLRNFVMSDDSSMDEAMAAARNETDREATTQQLDAFHKTFNFCMTCRQYTCGNCWNEVEGRCLSCAPLSDEIAPTPFPNLDAGAGLPFATSQSIADEGNGHEQPENPAVEPMAWPTSDLMREEEQAAITFEAAVAEAEAAHQAEAEAAHQAEAEAVHQAEAEAIEPEPVFNPLARLDAFESAIEAEAEPVEAESAVEAEPVAAEPAALEPAAFAPIKQPEPEPEPIAAAPVEPEHVVVPEPVVVPESVAAAAPEPEPVAEPAPAAAPAPPPEELDDRVATAAAQTTDLFRRFRQPQNLDDAIAAYERAQTAADALAPTDAEESISQPEPTPVQAVPEPEFEPEPEPVPEPVAAAPAWEPPAAPEPEPVVAATPAWEPPPAPEPEHEPVPEPVAAEHREDLVPQPTWQIVAPDATDQPEPPAPPQWPAQPEWPSQPPSEGLPFLGRPAQPTGGIEALWAESARQVASTSGVATSPTMGPAGRTSGGVQPCVSCGLSLSANARFCRRCGSRQG